MMKRVFIFLMTLLLVISTCTCVSFAEEASDTLYFNVELGGNLMSATRYYVPTFDVEIAYNGQSSVCSCTPANYSDGVYRFELSLGDYKSGDAVSVTLLNADYLNTADIITGISASGYSGVSVNEPLNIVLYEDEPYLDAPVQTLGSKDMPLICKVDADTQDKLLVVTLDENEETEGDISLIADPINKEGQKKFTTDENGLALIDISDISGSIEFFPDYDSTYVITSSNYTLAESNPNSLLYFAMKVKDTSNAVGTSSTDSGDVILPQYHNTTNISVASEDNTTLFNFSDSFVLTLTASDGTVYTYNDLGIGVNALEIPDGTYTVSVSSSVAEASYPDTLTAGSDYSVKLKSKYFLEVRDSSSTSNGAYDFSVVNIPEICDTKITGTGIKSFAVTPGMSVMLCNNKTEQTFSVFIKEGTFKTSVDLSTGFVKDTTNKNASDGAPKTYDNVDILVLLALILLVLLFMGIITLRVLRKCSKTISSSLQGTASDKVSKKSKFSLSRLLSMFLVVALMATLTPSYNVFAGGSSTGTTTSSGGHRNSTGNLQFWNENYYSSIIKVHLTNLDTMSETDATIEDLEDQKKFWSSNSDLFICTNAKDYERWQNGGMIRYTDANGGGFYTELGTNWDNTSEVIDQDEKMKRTLPIATDINNLSWTDNEWIRFILPFFDVHRNLETEYGKDLDTYMRTWLNLNGEKPAIQEYTDSVVNGYFRYLQENVGLSDEEIAVYKEAYNEGKLSLVFETMLGAYRMNIDGGVSSKIGFYMTISDAMKILKWSGASMSYPLREVEVLGNYFAQSNYRHFSCNGHCSNSNCDLIGHMRFSAPKVLIEKYLRTLAPMASCLQGYSQNPFGGWAFFRLGDGTAINREVTPGVYGEIHYHVLDENESEVDSFISDIENYTYEKLQDNKLIPTDFDFWENTNEMEIPAKVVKERAVYVAYEKTAKLTLYGMDADNNPTWFINPFPDDTSTVEKVLLDHEPIEAKLLRDSTEPTEDWLYSLNSTLKEKLSVYLSNDEIQGIYAGQADKCGNVKVVFDVNIKLTDTIISDSDVNVTVPEWRINKYFPSILDYSSKGIASATFSLLNLTKDTGCSKKSSYLSSENGQNFMFTSPVLSDNTVPVITNAKSNSSLLRKIKHHSPTDSIGVFGDLMLFKDSTIDNLYLADWVNNIPLQYGDYAVSTNSGDALSQGATTVIKDFDMSYCYSPIKAITHYATVRSHSTRKGKTVCNCYYLQETPETSITNALYSTTAVYKCYNNQGTASNAFTSVSSSEDGKVTFTNQSSKELGIFAEVPMFYTDKRGNNSVYFVSADNKTFLKPISYHSLIATATIDPTVVGTSIATDSRALAKAEDLGVPTIIHKGGGTTTSYDINGKITAKTYAIDVSSIALKTKWDISGYTAAGVNNEFLNTFSHQDAMGNYIADAKATENLKIFNELYGNVDKDISIMANGTDCTAYRLTVRAGEITAINGYKNWTVKYPELVEPIAQMKLNHDGVFGVFASGKGASLDEDAFASLASRIREDSNSIALGTGWYSEDTTLLSLYVYTTEFALTPIVFQNKIPQSITGLDTPVNKNDFYSVATEGGLKLKLELQSTDDRAEVTVDYDSTEASQWSPAKRLYGVPNVSILDTTISQ